MMKKCTAIYFLVSVVWAGHSQGQVGIGISAPWTSLHVHAPDTTLLTLSTTQMSHVDPTSGIRLFADNLAFDSQFGHLGNEDFKFNMDRPGKFLWTSENDVLLMSLMQNGNLGLGLENASTILHLRNSNGPTLTLESIGANALTSVHFKGPESWHLSQNVALDKFEISHTDQADVLLKHLTMLPGGQTGLGLDSARARLDVDGAVIVGHDNAVLVAGAIRFNPTTQDFEGYDGCHWRSLTGGDKSTVEVFSSRAGNGGTDLSNRFGTALHFGNSLMAVGYPWYTAGAGSFAEPHTGAVNLYHKISGRWDYRVRLQGSSGVAGDRFGTSLSVNGIFMVIGAPGTDVLGFNDMGKVYIFRKGIFGDWSEVNSFVPFGGANDHFGQAVLVYGDDVFVGSPHRDVSGNSDVGSVFHYKRTSGNTFSLQQIIQPGTLQAGQEFGSAMAFDGTDLLIAAPKADNIAGTNAGTVYRFAYSGTAWNQTAVFLPPATGNNLLFGTSLDIDGDLLAIGFPAADTLLTFFSDGKVAIYDKVGSLWLLQTTLNPSFSPSNEGDAFGYSLDLYDNHLLVGAPFDFSDGAGNGAAYLYKYSDGSWDSGVKITDPMAQPGAHCGHAVGLNLTQVSVASPWFENDRGRLFVNEINVY